MYTTSTPEEKRFPISIYLTDTEHQEFLKLLLGEVFRLRNEMYSKKAENEQLKNKLKELGIDMDNQDWWMQMRGTKEKLGIKE